MKTHPPAVSHDAAVVAHLRDHPDYAREYLRVALEEATDDEGRVALLTALKRVAEAQGMANVAEAARIPRESLYRALSPRGNPRFSTLMAIVRALGLKMTLMETALPHGAAAER